MENTNIIEDSKKRELIVRYFENPPKPTQISYKFLLLCALGCGITFGFGWKILLGVCLVIVAIAYVALVIWMNNNEKKKFDETRRASDEEFDQWLEDDLDSLKSESLNATGIDNSELVGETVSIIAPRVAGRSGAELKYKKGADNNIRYTPIDVTLIHFTEHQLISYQAVLDFTTGKPLSPSTNEYFYNDIVSVSTSTESTTVRAENGETIQYNNAEMFKMVTSGGTSMSVLLSDPKLVSELGGSGELPKTRAEKAVQVIRRMLRDKKSR